MRGYYGYGYGGGLQPETRAYWAAAPTKILDEVKVIDQYFKTIKYGAGITFASVTTNISNPAVSPLFLSNPSVDLSPYASLKTAYLTLTDTSSKTMKVLVGAAAAITGETLGDELITSWTNGTPGAWEAFNTFTAHANGHDITSAIKSSGASRSYGYSNNLGMTTGWLYKSVITPTINSGSGLIFSLKSTNESTATTGSLNIAPTSLTTSYGTRTDNDVYHMVITGVATNINFSLLASLKQVLTPSLWGCWFSAPNVESGFLLNSTSFIATITKD